MLQLHGVIDWSRRRLIGVWISACGCILGGSGVRVGGQIRVGSHGLVGLFRGKASEVQIIELAEPIKRAESGIVGGIYIVHW